MKVQVKISSRTTHGDKYLKTLLVQCGWTATRTKNTYLRSKYDSLVGRRGKQINYYLNQLKEQGFEILTLLVFATF